MSSDRIDRIWRTVFQAAVGFVLTGVAGTIAAAQDAVVDEAADAWWAGLVTAALTSLTAAVQNWRDSRRDTA